MNPYQIDRDKLENEARARIFWGDPPEEIVNYLRVNGLDYDEAAELVDGWFRERAANIRGSGLRKMLIGPVLMLIPAAYFFTIGISLFLVPLLAFSMTVVVGLYGTWLLVKGATMFFAPYSEPGDVADQ